MGKAKYGDILTVAAAPPDVVREVASYGELNDYRITYRGDDGVRLQRGSHLRAGFSFDPGSVPTTVTVMVRPSGSGSEVKLQFLASTPMGFFTSGDRRAYQQMFDGFKSRIQSLSPQSPPPPPPTEA